MDFDNIADRYELWYKQPVGHFADEVENRIIQNFADINEGERVLDAGCGTGLYTLRAVERGAEVTAIDPSGEMLRVLRKKLEDKPPKVREKVRIIQCGAEDIPLPNESIDVVISVTAMEFFRDRDKALLEFQRVIKPGGRVVVGVLNARGWWAAHRRKKKNSIYESAHFYTPKELHDVLSRYFQDVEIACGVMLPPHTPAILIPLFRVMEKPLSNLFPSCGAFIAARGWKV